MSSKSSMHRIGRSRASPAPRLGRPRSAQAHRAVLGAAAGLFVEVGFDGMSVEGVARKAGVGKATIYRRWSSKEELVIDAIAQLFSEPWAANTGDARNDLVTLARNLHQLMSSRLTGGVFPRMAPEVAAGSRLGRLYAERIIGPRKAMLSKVLLGAIERGELPLRTDVDLALDLLVGTFLVRRLTGRLKRSDAALPQRVVDMILEGLRARRA